MAGYESLRDWSLVLGNAEAAALIEETLEEERTVSTRLNILANDGVHERAMLA